MLVRHILFGGPSGGLWKIELAAGVIFVAIGILIAIYPEILVAIISGLVILVGVSLIGAGLRGRRTRHYQPINDYDVIDPGP